MHTESDECFPQVDNAIAIEMKTLHCRSASRGDAEHRQSVRAPPKVFSPSLPARIVKRGTSACRRILCRRRGELMTVASLAGPRQVVQVVRAAARAWADMFHGVGTGGEAERTAAVFAQVARAFGDESPGLSHTESQSNDTGRKPSSAISD